MGVFGLRGQLKVAPLTDFLERFEPGAPLLLDGEPVEIEEAQVHQGKMLLKLKGIDSVDEGRAIQFHYLEAPADFVPELGEDEYMTADLVGLQVATTSGETLGIVNNVLQTPAHDVIVVGEILIPAVKEFVKEVDVAAGRMVVELIEGMRPGE